MALQKYDVPVSGDSGEWQVKWWSPINTPILGPEGQVEWILHRVEDVTEFVLSRHSQSRSWGEKRDAMEAELFARAQELQRLNQELREANEREHQTALTLQEAMLHSPDLPGHREIAVRYMPALRSLNVCGDWYDVVDLSEERFAVAVGDVVGHGLEAAAVMGMLRSALTTAIRALHEPGQAMDALNLYAGTIREAVATTAVKAVIDTRHQRITYTSAGHPAPFLSRADGTVVLLDQATGPPLGISPEHSPRPEATVTYTPGDILVLYTDGLVERRGEDIDAGLYRLSDALARHAHMTPDRLADTLLMRLGVADGGRDDIALIIVRL
jgi:serine phosphatase RsbU (regulator of sigma subunit)